MRTEHAIKHYGSASKLARALGIGRSAVSMWGDTVPANRQFQLEVLTRGKLKAARPAGPRQSAA